ncbi:MAG: hypothetical protein WCA35_30905, partial [Kovacikia sp.]
MAASNTESSERREAGQKVSLIRTIKRLIRAYPGGLGIIKELIQNADDADARTVQITLDRRNYKVEQPPESGMGEFLGPSLLVFNDAVFNEENFEKIQEIGEGSKQTDPTKAGRFGLGFNSVYHITDYPSVVSLDRIIFFDPHKSVFKQGGAEWSLNSNEIKEFLKLYEAGLATGCHLENSTVFRLPLRLKPQAN